MKKYRCSMDCVINIHISDYSDYIDITPEEMSKKADEFKEEFISDLGFDRDYAEARISYQKKPEITVVDTETDEVIYTNKV